MSYQKIDAKRAKEEAKKDVGVAESRKGENEVKKPKEKNPGEVSHVGVTGNSPQPLFGAPDTKDKALKIERKVDFGVKGVPAGEKGARGVIFESDQGDKKEEKKGKEKW